MQIHSGDCLQVLKTLPDKSIQCCVTSPPYYGLRNYDADGQLGMEESPAEYIANLVAVFREVRRVLRDDGTVFLNLGDSYAGHGGYSGDHFPSNQNSLSRHSQGQRLSGRFHKRGRLKNLLMIPARVAIALQDDGWTLRSDIIWHKPVPMPESVKDRPTRAHEHVFMLVQQQKYYYDAAAIATPSKAPTDDRRSRSKAGQKRTPTDSVNGIRAGSAVYATANARDVWKISTRPYKGAHFAVMPIELAQRCILAGTSKHGCCSECGAPWERVVKRTAADGRSVTITAQSRYARDDAGHLSSDNRYEQVQTSSGVRASFKCANVLQNSDLGWQASCSCNAKVIPCMVLDPFGGAGTTGEAALGIGRDVTLIELNAEYIKLIESRLIPLAAIMQV